MNASRRKLRVLFLCTGNSCRSQMAEGWARRLLDDCVEPFSAGIKAQGLNPHAVRVMREAGVDISGQQSQTVTELSHIDFDVVVAVCEQARQGCPAFEGTPLQIRAPFDDPPELARGASTDEEMLAPYRRVRDEIRRFVEDLPNRVELTC